jgi:peptide/nickel transport system substrate-binding protein
MNSGGTHIRVLAIVVVPVLAFGGCGSSTTATPGAPTGQPTATSATAGGSSSGAPAGSSASPQAGAPQKGGTIYQLTDLDQFLDTDPQRVYTGDDMAFLSATIYRTLTQYRSSPDNIAGTTVVPDLATDTGTVADGGRTWSFTLRDGVSFEDGSPITCADVAYGVSRTFATNVIIGGPSYAISMLDIPKAADGSSAYKGPYVKTGQELYDKAVTCTADGRTISFHLNRPVPDFDYTVTMTAFSPVPREKDTGEQYGAAPVSSGPYRISEYTTGNGGKMVMVRNDSWDPASDPIRKAWPDQWEVDFGIDPKIIDQRLIESAGRDQFAIGPDLQPENQPVVFVDPATPQPRFAGRAVSGLSPFVRYFAINVKKVPNLGIRRAIAAALDREAIRRNVGGVFAGDLGDGVVNPTIGVDYAPTGLWETLLGRSIPPEGDPAYARQLIAGSGEAAPTITFDYLQSATNDTSAAIVKASLEEAGFTVNLNPVAGENAVAFALNDAASHELIMAVWGPDWPNASTVIPELFTPAGEWNLSRADDPAYNAKVDAARAELDRATQATMWQQLNTEAMAQQFAVPMLFLRQERLAGSRIAPVYLWPAYASWPYDELYVAP